MASRTYKTRALVLKKTKLREKDLIVTLLDESGALVKGVAKGARKPGGSLAARLELFSFVDVLMACGRSLDIVCEARIADGEPAQPGIEQAACAAPLAELLCLVAQPDLSQPRLFELSRAAFARMLGSGEDGSLAILAASLWKVMAQSGYRPNFKACAFCGSALEGVDSREGVVLSLSDGGLVCANCPRPADAIVVDADVMRWCDALLMSRFEEVEEFGIDARTAFSTLHLSRAWIRAHTGSDLKSLDFLFTGGLF